MTTPEIDRILDAAPIGVAVQDAAGKFVRANRAYLDMVGFSLEELLDMSWREITHPADAKAQARIMDAVRQSGRPADFVKRFVTKAGRAVWARATFGMTEGGDAVVFVVPEPDAEPPPTLVQSLGRTVMENWKTGAMLIATAVGSIWAQYQSFVVRIESAERRAAQAEHDVDLLKPLLLKFRGEVDQAHPADPPK